MSNLDDYCLVLKSTMRAISEAIRTRAKQGGGGVTPSGTLRIEENGTFDVTNYASAWVAVPTQSAGGEWDVFRKTASGLQSLSLSASEIGQISAAGSVRDARLSFSDGTNTYTYSGLVERLDSEAIFCGYRVDPDRAPSPARDTEFLCLDFSAGSAVTSEYYKNGTRLYVPDTPEYLFQTLTLSVYLPVS